MDCSGEIKDRYLRSDDAVAAHPSTLKDPIYRGSASATSYGYDMDDYYEELASSNGHARRFICVGCLAREHQQVWRHQQLCATARA